MRETSRAKVAWADYLAMGAGRSLEKLSDLYQKLPDPPTRQKATLSRWSQQHTWQARLAEIADREAREIAERQSAYRRAIMEEGLALDHERVKALKELANILFEELLDPSRRWCRDVKQIGSGEGAERVDIERFNATEVEQLRGLLDDIAKEKSERVSTQKHELTGKDGQAIEVKVEDARQQLAARLAALTERRRESVPDRQPEPAGSGEDPA